MNENLSKAQQLGKEADAALYSGQWLIAYEKFNQAVAVSREALKSHDMEPQVKDMLEKQILRFIENSTHLEGIIYSDPLVNQLENQSYISSYLPTTEGESFYPWITQEIKVLDDNNNTTQKPEVNGATPLQSIWKGFERLIKYLPYNVNTPQVSDETLASEEIDIDNSNEASSFVLIDNPKVLELQMENEKLRKELSVQKILNQRLTEQKEPMTKSLLIENNILRKSISNFRHEVQKQSQQVQSMLNSRSGSPPIISKSGLLPDYESVLGNHSEILPRIQMSPVKKSNNNKLMEEINQLKLLLLSKDKEIEELKKYKVKWEKLRDDAREKKRRRQTISGGTAGESGGSVGGGGGGGRGRI
eukprot:TRINITY_DN305_c2_g4_i2.p1 TRINITY_DN305_c2_g4~~TRINITY_DN305_c2_g4_i2.p1  ORF type:complete len:360 (-),score=45.02 TRINITY_DN305_c2_g4_i2:58-1137(-)